MNISVSNAISSGFCTTHWIEDKDKDENAQRAIRLWPNIVKVIKHCQGLCKSKRPKN